MESIFDEILPKEGLGYIKWGLSSEPDAIGMGVADMDFKTAPAVTEALVRTAASGMFSYHFKPDTYYESIVDWYHRTYNLPLNREWILNTPGTWAAFELCLQSFTQKGDGVIIQTPRFEPILNEVEYAGCQIITNPMILRDGKYELDFEDFENKIRTYHPAVYFMVNPHNPTGRVFTKEELTRLGRICLDNHVLMISDEVHSIITYDGHPHTPAFGVCEEMAQNCIVLLSPSKGYNLMDLTYCLIMIPNDKLRKKYEQSMRGYNFNFATNIFSVSAVQAAFSRASDPWVKDVTAYLADNLMYLKQFFSAKLPGIRVIIPEGSYFVWLDFREYNLTPDELRKRIEHQARVVLTWGETFGPDGEGFERLNFACPRATLDTALDRLYQVFKQEE